MKKFYYIVNIFLIVGILTMLFVDSDLEKSNLNNKLKYLNTSIMSGTSYSSGTGIGELNNKVTSLSESTSQLELNVNQNITSSEIITDVLETQVGSMSAYGPDCSGCSGRLGADLMLEVEVILIMIPLMV